MTSALSELEAVGEFDYVVVNDDLDSTVSAVESILVAERSALGRQGGGVRNRADQLARDLKNTMGTL